MSLTVKREKQIKKEGVKRTKVPLIRIGVSDKPRPHNCQFEPIRNRALTRILKIGVKNNTLQKKLEFYHSFLLALSKKLESDSKSWSKKLQIRS